MQTLPSSIEANPNVQPGPDFKYWLKLLLAVALFIAPQVYFAVLCDYAGLLGTFIGDPTYCKDTPVFSHFDSYCCTDRLADFGYDTARDFSRLVTAITFAITSILTFKLVFLPNLKKLTLKVVMRVLAWQYSFPVLVHLIGTFAINNYGGIGGGL